MAATSLSAWLRRVPHPAWIMADNQKVLVPTQGNRWKELHNTITALEPLQVVAYAADGGAIRALQLRNDSGEETGATADSGGSKGDTELETFARLLADAYGKAANAQQPIIDSAMQFIERLSKRLADTEGELQKVRHHYARLLEDVAHERAETIALSAGQQEGSMIEQAVGALVTGAVQGQAARLASKNGVKTNAE